MKLTVTWVHQTTRGLEVWFEDQVYNEQSREVTKYTPLGRRAMRILQLFAPHSFIQGKVYDSGGRALLIEGAFTPIPGLENQAQAQAHMDQYADCQLIFQCLRKRIRYWQPDHHYGAGIVISDAQAFNKARAQNCLIRFELAFQLNLPVYGTDSHVLLTLLPGETVSVSSTDEFAVRNMIVRVDYNRYTHANKDSRTLLEELEATVRQAFDLP